MSKKFSTLEPYFLQDTPDGLRKYKLTFDDLLTHRPHLKVRRFPPMTFNHESCTLLEACYNMREENPVDPSKYTLSLASDDDYDKIFKLPKLVNDIDLFTPLGTTRTNFKYLRTQSKLLSGLKSGYRSPPTIIYGGASEWIYVLSGKVDMKLIKPTKLNVLKQQTWDPSIPCKWEASTVKYSLEANNFINIPCGWISEIKAKSDSFFLSGEYLHHKNFASQLENFARDVSTLSGKYAIDRDFEIRYIHWLYSAYLLETDEGKKKLTEFDKDSFGQLKEQLSMWIKKNSNSKTHLVSLYVPPGLRCQKIRRDLHQVVYNSGRRDPKRRASLKGP